MSTVDLVGLTRGCLTQLYSAGKRYRSNGVVLGILKELYHAVPEPRSRPGGDPSAPAGRGHGPGTARGGQPGGARPVAAADHHLAAASASAHPAAGAAGRRYKIDELEVDARLVDQVAQVQVSQSFVNTGSRPLEVSFIFPLPYDGAIDQMTLLVDGKEYPAKLLDAKEARRIYEEIVRKNRDPALLEWMGTGMFQTSVFPVPPGAKRTVSLALRATLPQAGRADRLPLPAEHGEVHVAAGGEGELPRDDREPGADQERLQPDARGRDQAARRPARDGHATRRRTRCPRPISACSTTWAAAS